MVQQERLKDCAGNRFSGFRVRFSNNSGVSGCGCFGIQSWSLRVSGFRRGVLWVSGPGVKVSGLRSRVSRLGVGVLGFGFRVLGFGFRISDFEFQISGFGFRVLDFGFRGSDFGLRV